MSEPAAKTGIDREIEIFGVWFVSGAFGAFLGVLLLDAVFGTEIGGWCPPRGSGPGPSSRRPTCSRGR